MTSLELRALFARIAQTMRVRRRWELASRGLVKNRRTCTSVIVRRSFAMSARTV